MLVAWPHAQCVQGIKLSLPRTVCPAISSCADVACQNTSSYCLTGSYGCSACGGVGAVGVVQGLIVFVILTFVNTNISTGMQIDVYSVANCAVGSGIISANVAGKACLSFSYQGVKYYASGFCNAYGSGFLNICTDSSCRTCISPQTRIPSSAGVCGNVSYGVLPVRFFYNAIICDFWCEFCRV